jgi:hypothetical protein
METRVKLMNSLVNQARKRRRKRKRRSMLLHPRRWTRQFRECPRAKISLIRALDRTLYRMKRKIRCIYHWECSPKSQVCQAKVVRKRKDEGLDLAREGRVKEGHLIGVKCRVKEM